MKIVVLVERVPGTADDACFASDPTVGRAALRARVDEPGEYAIEQAVCIAREHDKDSAAQQGGMRGPLPPGQDLRHPPGADELDIIDAEA